VRRIKRACAVVALLGLAVAAMVAAQAPKPRTHRLEAPPETVAYGYYWSEAKPALRIASGDILDVDSLLASNPAALGRAGVPPEKIQPSLTAITTQVTGDPRGPGGHILTGPVFVEGAEPGDALEVKLLSIDFAIDYGYNGCSGFVPENCDKAVGTTIIPIDKKTMTARFMPGIVIPLRPFYGSMGVAPAPELGRVSSVPPGRHAGNIDNRELIVGSTVYIPVFVPGALFELGDGHAAQGDGEVDQTAIETSLRGRLQLTVRKGMTLVWPRAETPTDYIMMATDPGGVFGPIHDHNGRPGTVYILQGTITDHRNGVATDREWAGPRIGTPHTGLRTEGRFRRWRSRAGLSGSAAPARWYTPRTPS
jgi:acetamidase/formamidase